MLWYITYNRIECGVPFLLYDKFFTLVRVTAGMELQFAQFFPLVKVVVVDYTLLSFIKKTVIPVDDIGIQGQQL